MGTITWPGLRGMPSLFSSAGGRLLSVGDVEEPITATLTRPSSLRFWYGASTSDFAPALVQSFQVGARFPLPKRPCFRAGRRSPVPSLEPNPLGAGHVQQRPENRAVANTKIATKTLVGKLRGRVEREAVGPFRIVKIDS